jgi:glycosyltransferase involved in cell wall biosynthesis
VIEAMNAGLHIVYTAVGGIPDILEGYLGKTMLADGSTNEIVKTLLMLIPKYNAKEDDRSIVYARQFDWKNVAKQVEMIYSEIAK